MNSKICVASASSKIAKWPTQLKTRSFLTKMRKTIVVGSRIFFLGGKNFQIPTRDIILWISVTDHPKFCQSQGIFSPSVDLSTNFSFNNFTPFFCFFGMNSR